MPRARVLKDAQHNYCATASHSWECRIHVRVEYRAMHTYAVIIKPDTLLMLMVVHQVAQRHTELLYLTGPDCPTTPRLPPHPFTNWSPSQGLRSCKTWSRLAMVNTHVPGKAPPAPLWRSSTRPGPTRHSDTLLMGFQAYLL